MNLALAPKFLRLPIRLLASLCALAATAFSVDLVSSLGNVLLTHGTGTSTVTDITYNADDTITLKAEQKGTLLHLGKFNGDFTYLATIDYNTGLTLITGNGRFNFGQGDKLHLSASIVEVGLDYPRPFTGALTITGGTGRFTNASGVLEITGIDEESLTDGIVLSGTISTNGSRKNTSDY